MKLGKLHHYPCLILIHGHCSELGLKIKAPRNSSYAVWPDNLSYTEVFIQAPDNAQLSCDIEHNHKKVENGSLAQFNNDKKLWQLLHAPERTGFHELIVYAKRNDDSRSTLEAVVKFNLNVDKLRQPMKLPLTYTQFRNKKCQIYTPIDGILKRGSVVLINCIIPGAVDVNLTAGSQWLKSEGYSATKKYHSCIKRCYYLCQIWKQRKL